MKPVLFRFFYFTVYYKLSDFSITDPCRRLPTGRQYSDGQTCYGYYKCLKGQSVSGICPSGFAFNAYKQGCLPDNTCIQPSGIMHRELILYSNIICRF